MISFDPLAGAQNRYYASIRAANSYKGKDLVSPLSSNAFRTKLFKHINDHYSGQGHLSKEMYSALNEIDKENSKLLTEIDPTSTALYGGYLTAGFAYDKKARFVNAVKTTAQTMSKLTNLPEEA